MTMHQFADHVIAVAKENRLPITNLQLQKVMYFAFKLAKEDQIIEESILRKMYDQPFEVWQYGPVIREQYLRFRIFSSEIIIGHFEKSSVLEPLNTIIIELLKTDVFTLIDISHRLPFWLEHSSQISGYTSTVQYQFEDI
ncbi:Panacea domain-containing protein [Streptococcus gordonii]|uniref:Panacea domain-containing protein n=1 Tax=Streptococcus gordonii TaxID=1302 RepID=UPI0022840A63|nr:hypothetical protein [Streptococcus gordonii]MCY7136510.1 hypothetical protein [Streptococcus gordonii]